MTPRLQPRDAPPRTCFALEQAGVHPLLARLLAARGVRSAAEVDDGLQHLLPPGSMKGAAEAARLLADVIEAGRAILAEEVGDPGRIEVGRVVRMTGVDAGHLLSPESECPGGRDAGSGQTHHEEGPVRERGSAPR